MTEITFETNFKLQWSKPDASLDCGTHQSSTLFSKRRSWTLSLDGHIEEIAQNLEDLQLREDQLLMEFVAIKAGHAAMVQEL